MNQEGYSSGSSYTYHDYRFFKWYYSGVDPGGENVALWSTSRRKNVSYVDDRVVVAEISHE